MQGGLLWRRSGGAEKHLIVEDAAVKRTLWLAPILLVALLAPALLSSSAGALVSTGGWSVQQTTPSGGGIRAACFVDATHGWAVDTDGFVWITTDGATWSRETTPVGPADLYSITFPDLLHGWIVGYGGIILATSDGGATWVEQTSGEGAILHGVSFPDVNDGWAVGSNGAILATSDGGAHWAAQASGTALWLHGLSFPDTSDGWIAGDDGLILTTNDGGAHWTSQDSGTDAQLLRVRFLDDAVGWAVGDLGTILVTTDGGAHWSPQSSGTLEPLDALAVLDAQHAWVAGANGTILVTTDGGAHWATQDSGTTDWLHAICFPEALHGWAFGDQGQIYSTSTGGMTPPRVAASGVVDRAWYNHALLVPLTATPGTNAVASLSYTCDGAMQQVSGTTAEAPIPVDARTHANDGGHVLTFCATDTLGLASSVGTLTVNIDTRKPATKAPYRASATRGRTATLRFGIADAKPNGGNATVTIKVKNSAGKIVKTLGPAAKKLSPSLTWRFTVPRSWRAGTYRFFVYAKDRAGNAQANVASNRLTVK